MCLRLSIKQVIANYSHCCNNTVLVGTYWLDSRVVGGTSCNIWSAPRFDLRPYAVSLVCEFAARRCEIKWGVATFADDTKIFKTIVTQEDSSLLQADLRNLASWSSKEQSMVVLDSGIPDSKALVFRFHKQTFSGFSLALGNDIWMQAKQLVDFWIRRLR